MMSYELHRKYRGLNVVLLWVGSFFAAGIYLPVRAF